jgi:hypothetical protein
VVHVKSNTGVRSHLTRDGKRQARRAHVYDARRAGLRPWRENAIDEAAFLIIATLALPIDEFNPWLNCRLTAAEHDAIDRIIFGAY